MRQRDRSGEVKRREREGVDSCSGMIRGSNEVEEERRSGRARYGRHGWLCAWEKEDMRGDFGGFCVPPFLIRFSDNADADCFGYRIIPFGVNPCPTREDLLIKYRVVLTSYSTETMF